jgi:hypothetical protein
MPISRCRRALGLRCSDAIFLPVAGLPPHRSGNSVLKLETPATCVIARDHGESGRPPDNSLMSRRSSTARFNWSCAFLFLGIFVTYISGANETHHVCRLAVCTTSTISRWQSRQYLKRRTMLAGLLTWKGSMFVCWWRRSSTTVWPITCPHCCSKLVSSSVVFHACGSAKTSH